MLFVVFFQYSERGIMDHNRYYGKVHMRNRSIKINITNATCELCGEKGAHVHHKDGGKRNHELDNLQMLCTSCHIMMHSGERANTSKRREYGMTMKKIAKIMNISVNTAYARSSNNTLVSPMVMEGQQTKNGCWNCKYLKTHDNCKGCLGTVAERHERWHEGHRGNDMFLYKHWTGETQVSKKRGQR